MPRIDDVDAQLDRLADLQRRVRCMDGPFVLCHADFGGDNLLAGDDGRLGVLDWDDAFLAPPELDLRIGVEPHDGLFLPGILEAYAAAGGLRRLHADRFAFALLRRHLEDTAFRLLRLLNDETSPQEDEELIDGMRTEGFDRWSALDDTLSVIARAIS